jgi:4-amino-4-deoxy-L-arabinose transferase-like glycosyltransferase
MSQNAKYQLWIALAAGVIFFTNLGGAALFDMDEALYSTCAREMLGRDNWVVPWFNGEMFPEKPPLMFWTMIAGYELFGVNEWGARFFSAVMGVATALAAFHLGRILFNPRVGLWTGLITASTILFTISARAATVDSALTLVTTLAFLLLAKGWVGGNKNDECGMMNDELPTAVSDIHHSSFIIHHSPLNWFYAVGMYACIGLAVLAKGPVGMLLPLAAMGLFLLVEGGWRKLFRSAWWMRPFTAIVVMAAVAVPWYVWVGLETDWEWPRKFFIEFNLRPLKQPILGHGDAGSLGKALAFLVAVLYYFYHVPGVLVGFFPWSVFLGPTLVETVRRLRSRGCPNFRVNENGTVPLVASTQKTGVVLACCWFTTWFVLWSICKTKLPHYLLPAYPALAMLTACFIDRWLGDGPPIASYWLRNAWISAILAGVGIVIAIPIVAAIYLPGEWVLGLVGLILVLGGAWCWRETAHGRYLQAAVSYAIVSVLFLTAVFGCAVLRADCHQNAKPMIAAIRAEGGKGDSPHLCEAPFGLFRQMGTVPFSSEEAIAAYCFFRESTVFYAGHPVTKCDDEPPDHSANQALAAFLAKSKAEGKPAYLITTDEHEPEIDKAFPGSFRVVFRQRRFLAEGEMVVMRASELPSPIRRGAAGEGSGK